jgi:hypothetical protein
MQHYIVATKARRPHGLKFRALYGASHQANSTIPTRKVTNAPPTLPAPMAADDSMVRCRWSVCGCRLFHFKWTGLQLRIVRLKSGSPRRAYKVGIRRVATFML